MYSIISQWPLALINEVTHIFGGSIIIAPLSYRDACPHQVLVHLKFFSFEDIVLVVLFRAKRIKVYPLEFEIYYLSMEFQLLYYSIIDHLRVKFYNSF